MAEEEKNINAPVANPVNFSPTINAPQFYANGIVVGLTLTDVFLNANVNGRPNCQLILPLSAAKSLMDNLKMAIDDYERKSNTTVLDLNTLKDLMKK